MFASDGRRLKEQTIRLFAGLALFAVVATAQQTDSSGFQRTIQPFLTKNCYGCHNAKVQSGGLNLQSFGDADCGGERS
ncbi:MAG TPA: hypothetical protein VG273_15065 [Bryobacteraceae bacterium]|nr:hypothetical protein [Bryobacteraceae bacterium]